MKLGQLIEYNMRKIFLEKLYTKCGGETTSKKLKLSMSLDQYFIQDFFVFIVCLS